MIGDWEIRSVHEVADHCLGKMLDKTKNRGTLRPYLRNLNVRWFGFDLTDMLEMRFEDRECERYRARKDDLIICEGGYPGRAAIWPYDEPVYLQKALHRVRFSEPETAKWFLYLLYLSDLNGSLRNHFTGAGIQHFTGESLGRFRLPLPPLAEQRRIVAILDEAFAGIDAVAANTEKNLANARELFDSYLQYVFSNQEGGGERTLQQVSRMFGRGKSKHRPRNDPSLYDGPYPFIQTGDVRNSNHVIRESSQSYNESGLAQSKLWPKGTICITIAANIAETGILGFDACFPDSIIGMVVDESKATNDFVEYLLQATKAQLKAQGKGSAQDNINVATFENRTFLFPPLAEQRKIGETLNALSERAQQVEAVFDRKLIRLAELRQAILHKAFAGGLTAQPGKAMHEAAE